MQARQQAEELQRHSDHEHSGDNCQSLLSRVEATTQHRHSRSPRRAYRLAEDACEPAQEAIAGQSSQIVEKMAQRGCPLPVRVMAQCAGKAPAHPDRSEEHTSELQSLT